MNGDDKLRLVISNQRGGVAKTTTTHTLARYLADRGRTVLIIDTDPQGSIAAVLGLTARRTLQQLLIDGLSLEECVIPAFRPETGTGLIDVLASNRTVVETEATLMARTGREFVLKNTMLTADSTYDAVLIDTSPSISLLQTCAMMYAQRLFIPVAMDHLSLLGAVAATQTAFELNRIFSTDIKAVAYLPVMMQKQFQMTRVVMDGMRQLSDRSGVPILPEVRVDQTVTKAARAYNYLIDYDPKGRAISDYTAAFDQFMNVESVDAGSNQYEEAAPATA